ncbi:hypothetical protein PO909_033362 [Leuciscus waleckii]
MYGVRGIQCSSIDVAHWAVISLVCYEADPAVLAMLTALWGRGDQTLGHCNTTDTRPGTSEKGREIVL